MARRGAAGAVSGGQAGPGRSGRGELRRDLPGRSREPRLLARPAPAGRAAVVAVRGLSWREGDALVRMSRRAPRPPLSPSARAGGDESAGEGATWAARRRADPPWGFEVGWGRWPWSALRPWRFCLAPEVPVPACPGQPGPEHFQRWDSPSFSG